MRDLFLGIDGGGTKTEAVIVDGDGHFLAGGLGGPSNVNNIGRAETEKSIAAAVNRAAAAADVPVTRFAAAFLGLAGIISAGDRARLHEIGVTLDLAAADQIGVDHDCRIALAGGLAGAPGIVQILGTGASSFGVNAAGERWMAGGWGRLLADEGSGYWLGLQAIRAAVAAYDGRGAPTRLEQQILDAFGLAEVTQITTRLYTPPLPPSEIAALSRLVIDAAQQGDGVAQQIIETGMAEVARSIAAVAKKLSFAPAALRLVAIGGMLQAGEVITGPLQTAVSRHLPGVTVAQPQFAPALGAAILAAQRHQSAAALPTAQFLANLAQTASGS